ncbi:MAG: hypothetical protein P8186_06715, partial [Anaerolineae bacterium]
MRVAKDVLARQGRVLVQLTVRIQAPAGVVEIDVLLVILAALFAGELCIFVLCGLYSRIGFLESDRLRLLVL